MLISYNKKLCQFVFNIFKFLKSQPTKNFVLNIQVSGIKKKNYYKINAKNGCTMIDSNVRLIKLFLAILRNFN